MEIKISEQNLEDYLIDNIDNYFASYRLIDRQVKLGAGIGVADIILVRQLSCTTEEGSGAFPENDAEHWYKWEILVVELKIGQVTPQDVGQLSRYLLGIGDITEMEILSHNKKTHVFEFEIHGIIASPDITLDAFAICEASERITWQPYTISLESGLVFGNEFPYCASDLFEFRAESNVLNQYVNVVRQDRLGVEVKAEASDE